MNVDYYVSAKDDMIYKIEGDFNYQAQIDDIMNNFDFKCVKKVLKFLDIHWRNAPKTPNKEEIKEQALKLLHMVINEDNEYAACGCLIARKSFGHLSLTFEPTSWSAIDANIDADVVATKAKLSKLKDKDFKSDKEYSF